MATSVLASETMFDLYALYDLFKGDIRVIRFEIRIFSKWYQILGNSLSIRTLRFMGGRQMFLTF